MPVRDSAARRVRFVRPGEQYRGLKPEIDDALLGALRSGALTSDWQLQSFETALADYLGVRFAVGVNSGYHALHFALVAAGVTAGDEVITAGHTFVATVSAIVHAAGTPVLADVGDDGTLDVDDVERRITRRTKVLLPVHLNGRACDMARLMELAGAHGLHVIEDAAQALGASFAGRPAGTFGLAGCFSFYPHKALGACGDGGALVTNDAAVARLARCLRFNGEHTDTGEYVCHGYTALLDNVHAAVLGVKLRHLPQWLEHRRSVAARYRHELAGVGDLRLPHFDESGQRDSFQNYVVRSSARDQLRAFLYSRGIDTMVHWHRPMWRHPGLGLADPGCPVTERRSREVLSLPLSAETTDDDVDATVDAIRDFFGD
jgi:dTDP-4-amino-4,6-dideoxygalactose transaminase